MILSENEYQELLKNSHCKSRGDLVLGKKYHKISSLEEIIFTEFQFDPNVEILETQPHFEIVPGFERNGKKYQPIHYTSDFRIKEDEKEIIVEVKSKAILYVRRFDYPMRRKLFLKFITKNYPEIGFREIIFDDKKQRTVIDY